MKKILPHFGIDAAEADICPMGAGLINDTFKVKVRDGRGIDYVLQRINNNIFKNVDTLQHNIDIVTDHIRMKLSERGVPDVGKRSLRFLKDTETGKSYYFDGKNYWRIMEFLDNTFTRVSVSLENAYLTGKAFGDFQSQLADLPENIEETIPDFHNMEFRVKQFEDAISNCKTPQSEETVDLIEELLKRKAHACLAERLHKEGRLPKRICHCDTKVDNILFDKDGNVVCVIDLDTVMPSFVFSDFGDFLRSAANKGDEDDRDLDRVEFDMDIFKSFAKGYLEGAASFLTQTEVENLPYAAERFAYMQAVRFLTDYLDGSKYYKISYPEHNLVRAKAQFKLLQSIESHLNEMNDYIALEWQAINN